MSFAWGSPNAILWVVIYPAFFALIAHRLQLKSNLFKFLIGSDIIGNPTTKHFSINCSYNLLQRKDRFYLVAFFFLLIALMRPQWNQKEEIVTQSTRDLFIALDISRSMLSEDLGKSRLVIAKKKIRALLKQLTCERVGLILFSGSTFVQCPLTRDFGAFYMFLDHIDVETISSGSTALDQALLTTVKAFENTGPRKNRLLLVITDGEDFSEHLTDAIHAAHEADIRVCTLGVGSEQGGPIPLFDAHGKRTGHQKDTKGAIVISKLNNTLLQHVSKETGGTYVRVTKNSSDIQKVVSYVQSFETEAIEDAKRSRLEEQYPFFLIISFLCLAIEWIL